jgi:predicted amidophosphoribosyltransferase
MRDEGPSDDDLRRFGDEAEETALCPACGAEVWDLADVCSKCGEYMISGPGRRSPEAQRHQQRWVVVLIVLLIIALLGIGTIIF